jgi:hypothetical protein
LWLNSKAFKIVLSDDVIIGMFGEGVRLWELKRLLGEVWTYYPVEFTIPSIPTNFLPDVDHNEEDKKHASKIG